MQPMALRLWKHMFPVDLYEAARSQHRMRRALNGPATESYSLAQLALYGVELSFGRKEQLL